MRINYFKYINTIKNKGFHMYKNETYALIRCIIILKRVQKRIFWFQKKELQLFLKSISLNFVLELSLIKKKKKKNSKIYC